MSLIEWLFGKTKSPEQLKMEIEESNEEHYRQNKLIVLRESRVYKQKYKELLEHMFNKPIEKITLRELIGTGFISNNLTTKHCKELGLDK